MSPELDRLRIEAASLDVAERELLAYDLLDSLSEQPVEPDLEAQWRAEAIRRVQAHDRGEVQAVSEEDALAFLGFPKAR